jgi:hypothetical protein
LIGKKSLTKTSQTFIIESRKDLIKMYDDLTQRIIDWFCDNDGLSDGGTRDLMIEMKKKYGRYEPNNLVISTVNEVLSDLYEDTVRDEEYNLIVDFEAFLESVYYDGETFEEVTREYFDTYYDKFFDYDEMVEILKKHDFDSIDYHFAN